MNYKLIFGLLIIGVFTFCQNPSDDYEHALENCLQLNKEKDVLFPEMSFDCLIGTHLPNFKAKTLSGKTITNKSLAGKYSIINLWFTGCAPCVAEIPGLNAISEKYKTEVNYIAIGRDSDTSIRRFLEKHPWQFDHIPNGTEIIEMDFKLKKVAYPTTFILNKETEIVAVFTGGGKDSLAAKTIEHKISSALEGKN